MRTLIPFIGPLKYKHAGAPGSKTCPRLPIKRFRLFLQAVTPAVQTGLGEHKRTVKRDIVQAGEIGFKDFY